MGIFKRRPNLDDARVAGELLAIRVTLVVLLEEISADFRLAPDLEKFRAAGFLELREHGSHASTTAGFIEFMSSFIAAARKRC